MKGQRVKILLIILSATFMLYAISHAAPSREDSTEFRENLLPAQQGDAKAQVFVAYLYETGQGVPQDYSKAAQWYRKAAEKNNATAQTQIGKLYSQGKGVPQNYVLAYMWFDLAARQGYEQAIVYRDTVAKKMRRDQIAEARRLSQKWKPVK